MLRARVFNARILFGVSTLTVLRVDCPEMSSFLYEVNDGTKSPM